MKQAIILRTDLKLGKGKLVAQGAHASLSSFLKTKKLTQKAWQITGQKKVVLKVSSEKELLEIYHKAKSSNLPTSLIRDAGLTQTKPGTYTAVAIGPSTDKKIDQITGHLKLL